MMTAPAVPPGVTRILEIDLTREAVRYIDIPPQVTEQYLGGKGLGLYLLYQRLEPGTDPLGPGNFIVITAGAVTGTKAPCSSRFHAVFKSPLTGIVGSSSCGGDFGRQLKTCGLSGLVITGKSARPSVIRIQGHNAVVESAGRLWGQDIDKVREKVDSSSCRSLIIGPAGEKQVWFANAASGHRFLGRCGIGAVMGAKNLKCIVVEKGEFKTLPADTKKFEQLRKRAIGYINRNKMSLLNRNYGTASNALPVIENRMMPVRNFLSGSHEKALDLSGQHIARHHETRYAACHSCTILCGHKGRFNGRTTQVPEYETLALLGSNLGVFDPEAVSRFNDICNARGMDTISAGGTLAWVMEASEKGLVDTGLKFGDTASIAMALEDMASLNKFGKEMAKGSRWLSEKYGGKEFAMQCKGLEMAGYDPRGAYGQGLGYAVANRGACHLSSFPVAFENFLGFLKPDTTSSKALFVLFFEDIYCAVNSLGMCQFTGYAFTLEPFLSKNTPGFLLRFMMRKMPVAALSLVDFSLFPAFFRTAVGIPMSSRKFKTAGKRIHVLERWMNVREGISRKDDTLPYRVTDEVQAGDPDNRKVPLDDMIDHYYRVRGFDRNGIPKEELLKKLGIPLSGGPV